MLSVIRHRGPDDEGSQVFDAFAFGMRRLAILDRRLPATSRWCRGTAPRESVPAAPPRFQELRRELEALGCTFRSDRHGGHPRRVSLLGNALRRALQRHLGVRAVGRGAADAPAVARPLRRQAALHRRVGRPPGVRGRIKSLLALPWVSREPGRPRPCATSWSTAWSTIPTTRSSRGSPPCRRRTTWWSPPMAGAWSGTGDRRRSATTPRQDGTRATGDGSRRSASC